MHLTPHELDKLTLHQAGVLAQKRLARGVKLNHPEAVALIATQILEFIRDGRTVAELMGYGAALLSADDVMDGIPELIPEVQVEATFPDGTKLVTVHDPIAPRRPFRPGAIEPAPFGDIAINEGRATVRVSVANTGDRPIQVGSHYHFFETNPALAFDRALARGQRLNVPAGTAVRFEPGQTREVELVPFAGDRLVFGFRGEVMGPLDGKAASKPKPSGKPRKPGTKAAPKTATTAKGAGKATSKPSTKPSNKKGSRR